MLNLPERRRLLSPYRLVAGSVLALVIGFALIPNLFAAFVYLLLGGVVVVWFVIPVAVIHQTKHEKKSGVFSHLGTSTVHDLGTSS